MKAAASGYKKTNEFENIHIPLSLISLKSTQSKELRSARHPNTDLSSNVHILPWRDWMRARSELAMHLFPSQYKRTATRPLVRPGK